MIEQAARTSVRLCGEVEVRRDGELRRLPSRQLRMLLGYLSINRSRAVARDELIDAIWGERAVDSPEALLKTLLSRLRSAIGADLIQGREALRLTLGDGDSLDLDVLARQLAAAEHALSEHDPAAALRAADAAIEIAMRGFMPGHEAPWIEEQRRSLADANDRALELCARAAIELGGRELRRAQDAAQQLIERQPLEQTGYELLMRAHTARGELAAATAVFDQLRRRLRDEVGMTPSPQLVALNDRILSDGAQLAPEAELPPAARPRADFVGRSAELAELRELTGARGAAPPARLILLSGEAGIGKTELARKLAADAAARGSTVLYGRCEPTGAIPYRAFAEALAGRLPSAPESAREEAPVPYRDELAARVASAIREACGAHGCLLILEDLHWSDATTAAVLGELVAGDAPAGFVVIGTARLPELPVEREIARVLAELRADGHVKELALGGLEEGELSELIKQSGAPLEARSLAGALRAETRGNPLFARHLLRHFNESDAWGRLMGGARIATLGMPATLRDLLTLRVAQAGPGAIDLLSAGAVLGPEFDFRMAADLAELEPSRCLSLLESAQSLGLVRESGAGLFCFEHELIRATLYEALGETRRAWLHVRAADALERAAHAGEYEHAAEVAHHLLSAGPLVDGSRRRSATLSAARGAIEARAPEDAVALLERMNSESERPDPAVLIVLGDARRLIGARTAARAAYREAAELALARADADGFAAAAIGIADLGFGSWWGEIITTDAERVPLLQRAAEMLSGRADDAVAGVLIRLARERYWLDQERARAEGGRALELARELGSERLLCEALLTAHFTAWTPDSPAERFVIAQEAASLARGLGDPGLELRALLYLLDDATELVRPELAEQVRQRLGELSAEAPGLPELVWILGVTRAQDAMRRGQLETAAELAREAVAAAQQEHHSVPIQVFGGQIAVLRLLQGRFKQLETAQRGFIAASPHLPTWRCGLVYMLAEAGDRAAASRELAWLAANDFARVRRDNYWGVSMLLLAAGVLGLGDEAAAAAISRQLEPQAGHYAVVPPCAALAGPIELGLGCAQLTLGRTDAALRSFRSGAELAERLGDLPNELICRSGAAVAAVVLGADDGGTELSRSVAEGRRIGVPAIVERPGIASGILTAARRAGREDELQRAVAAAGVAPLRVPERPAKSRIQNAAENLRARGPDLLARVLGDAADEQLERRFGNRVSERALFTAMAKGFRPEEAHGFSGEIEYEVLRSDRRGASHWTLEVSGRRARALPRPSRRPAATIRLRLPTLIRLAAAVVNPTEAMLSGEIAISGDLELAGRLTGMFGGKLPEIATRGASVSGFAAATRA